MGHSRNREHVAGDTGIALGADAESAQAVASILHTLATPSRVRIIAALQAGPMTVSDIVEAVGMEQSAVSHQLRHLRDSEFLVAERQGRNVIYRLYDSHVLDLIEQALAHAEHLRLARPDDTSRVTASAGP